jgi:ATP-grasp domain-containing protein
MFFLDKPYISDFLKTTVRDNDIPVVNTAIAQQSDLYTGTNIISEEHAIEMAEKSDDLKIYTNSENAIGWIAKHLTFSKLPQQIELFKDKLQFREMTRPLYPEFFFREVQVKELKSLQLDNIPLPFIIKPAVGFFSMGVYKVSHSREWTHIVESILAEIDQIKDLYPEEVLGTNSFIIEQAINGEEFAIDAYYNANGKPVILSIFRHTFSSDTDVSDRVYTSSKEIIEDNLDEFTAFTEKIGKLSGVKNFPVHIELRRENNGTLLPIEVNPMRFGGWCSTADMSFHAYGVNPYLYYYSQREPDWPEVLKGKDGKLFSLIVLDNSTGKESGEITSFDYEKLLSKFEKPIELRRIDYRQYPLFGFLFAETKEENFVELENILNSDLNEFISTKSLK